MYNTGVDYAVYLFKITSELPIHTCMSAETNFPALSERMLLKLLVLGEEKKKDNNKNTSYNETQTKTGWRNKLGQLLLLLLLLLPHLLCFLLCLAENLIRLESHFYQSGAFFQALTLVAVAHRVEVDVILVVADEEQAEPGVEGVHRHDEQDADDVALLVGDGVGPQVCVDLRGVEIHHGIKNNSSSYCNMDTSFL